ncbi:MAG: NAD(P)-dependent oxidoreductase [Pseudomonadota bacterium]
MAHKTVLIGGFGFIGRNILEALHGDAFAALEPVVIDDLSNAPPGHEATGVKAHIGPYQSGAASEFLSILGKGPRTFIFLAGETRVAESKDRPMDFIAANIAEPSRFVLENVREGDHFILISTAGALFDGSFEVRVSSAYCPKNFYGATKAAEEMILEKLVTMRGGDFSVVRMTNVFGRYSERKKSAIHAFTRAAITGDSVTINGDGKQTRDFIYAGDVARGIATLAERARRGEPTDRINMLGSGQSIALMDVVTAIEKAAGHPLSCKQIAASELLATEPRDVIASPDDVRVLLGDNFTPFEDGIEETYNYYSSTPPRASV